LTAFIIAAVCFQVAK